MTTYTFKNDKTGSIKSIKVFAYHEALRKYKSENGWRLMSFKAA